MKRSALAWIVLLSAVPVYLITGSAIAAKGNAAKAPPAAAAGKDTGTEAADLRPDDGPRRSEAAEAGRSRGPRGEVL